MYIFFLFNCVELKEHTRKIYIYIQINFIQSILAHEYERKKEVTRRLINKLRNKKK